MSQFLKLGKVTPKEAERLRGRLQWFETFAAGRVAQKALRSISSLTSRDRSSYFLSCKEKSALEYLLNRVLSAPPLKIQAANLRTWIVFTDGACEGEDSSIGTLGGLLVNPDGKVVSYFSESVPHHIMRLLLLDSKHPIFELELLPVLVSMLLWRQAVACGQCVFYLDNEAAKGALIAGTTDTRVGSSLVQRVVDLELGLQVKAWYARVPTSSNPSDKPSRLDTSEVDRMGVPRSMLDWESLRDVLV